MLKPADKFSVRLMSKLPGCNVSDRRARLVKANIPVVETLDIAEDSMGYFKLA